MFPVHDSKHRFRNSVAATMLLLSLSIILLHAVVPHHHHHHDDECHSFCIHEGADDRHGCDGETDDLCLLQKLMSLLVIGTKDDELLGDLSLAAAHLFDVATTLHDFYVCLLHVTAPTDIADSLSVCRYDAIYVATSVSAGFSFVASLRAPPVA